MSIHLKEIEFHKKKLGERVKMLRESINMSQTELASLCDLEKTSISRIENGRTNVTLKTCVILSKALGVKLVDLFDISGETGI